VTLLSLPAELRNKIYGLALAEPVHVAKEHVFHLRFTRKNPNSWRKTCETFYQKDLKSLWALQPALSRTCRQLRDEVLAMYYGNGMFFLDMTEQSAPQSPHEYMATIADINIQRLRTIGTTKLALINSLYIAVDFGMEDEVTNALKAYVMEDVTLSWNGGYAMPCKGRGPRDGSWPTI
jgi:hypothetical protein